MTLCGEASLVNHGPAHSKAVTLFCRSWQCPNCHDGRVRRLIKEIINGHPQRILTLTCRSETKPTPAEQAAYMSASFRKLMLRIRKKYAHADHQYFAVFEAHKSGWPHLHIVMRGSFLPWEWLRDQWTDITGSGGVDIRFIHNPKDCAAYVAKYVGKDPHRYAGTKRYWKSAGWQIVWDDPPPPDMRFGRQFFIVPATPQALSRQWYRPGVFLWWEDDALIRGADPPPHAATIGAMLQAFDAAGL